MRRGTANGAHVRLHSAGFSLQFHKSPTAFAVFAGDGHGPDELDGVFTDPERNFWISFDQTPCQAPATATKR